MRTMFQMGFASRDMFWMGQAPVGSTLDVDTLVARLRDADTKLTVPMAFAAQPNYRALLGVDADRFDTMMAQAGDLANEMTNLEQLLTSHVLSTISDTNARDIDDYVNLANALLAIVQAHSASAPPTAVATTPSSVSTTQAAAQASSGGMYTPPKPTPAGVKPAPAKPVVQVASSGPSPLLIGGAAVAVVVGLALVLR